ncbi:hypothetical protein PUN28_007684 [Cardiocondyla obscurior]|uniref:Secreted protein n=1 Tax=Cardiocondyla obscurior TaxID=286306 RepID=A0AAW2E9P8_9HYME
MRSLSHARSRTEQNMKMPSSNFSLVLSLLSVLQGSRTRSAVRPNALHPSSRALAAVTTMSQVIIAGHYTLLARLTRQKIDTPQEITQ